MIGPGNILDDLLLLPAPQLSKRRVKIFMKSTWLTSVRMGAEHKLVVAGRFVDDTVDFLRAYAALQSRSPRYCTRRSA